MLCSSHGHIKANCRHAGSKHKGVGFLRLGGFRTWGPLDAAERWRVGDQLMEKCQTMNIPKLQWTIFMLQHQIIPLELRKKSSLSLSLIYTHTMYILRSLPVFNIVQYTTLKAGRDKAMGTELHTLLTYGKGRHKRCWVRDVT